jgi:hypothetical protein
MLTARHVNKVFLLMETRPLRRLREEGGGGGGGGEEEEEEVNKVMEHTTVLSSDEIKPAVRTKSATFLILS